MQSNKAIIVSAPSGSGKTTIVHNLLNNKMLNLEFSVSACSRPKRDQETEGKDYYFLSVEQFRSKIENSEFLEWQEVYNDHYYGTLRSEVDRVFAKGNNLIFDVDVVGGLNLKEYFQEDALAIFIMPPSIEELERRLRLRSTEEDEDIAKRVKKSNFEIRYAERFDLIVINDVLNDAIAEVTNAVIAFLQRK
ncbi:MAG: guanylate kinase [Bacteroidales bacterium]|nr:guanylate kinase [Bacteroidales bacterium]HOY38576.1 guanylate kinase [Bacteroidales bacterium]HQP03268.1 guanylate kinase [Bacteroidales bacterium]